MTVRTTNTTPTGLCLIVAALTLLKTSHTIMRALIHGPVPLRVNSTSFLTTANAGTRHPQQQTPTNIHLDYPRGGERSRSRSPGADRDGDTRIRDDPYNGRSER